MNNSVLGSKPTAFIQFCDKIKGKKQVLTMQYMPKHIQIGKAPLISFYFVTVYGTVNFCICTFKQLDRSYGYALRCFRVHLSKIFLRRMDKSYGFRP